MEWKPEVVMPGFICPLHGNAYIALGCPHINQGVKSGSLPEKIITMFVDYGEFFTVGGVRSYFKHFYCPACAVQYGYSTEDAIVSGEEFESMPEMKFIPDCADCFKEALNRGGIAIGATPPVGGPVISGGEA
jgi:hypothetical protein